MALVSTNENKDTLKKCEVQQTKIRNLRLKSELR